MMRLENRSHAFPRLVFIVFLSVWVSGQLVAKEIRVAVASNFSETMKALVDGFEANTDHEVTLIIGSTGKQYAQIINGAPFDLFFAADMERPKLLEREGLALPDTRFTYAVGKLVLWSPKTDYVDPEGSVLKRGDFRFLAIANPKLAPYGKAAQEALEELGLWDGLTGKIVRGENITQAYQFVKSGNAELGFVAYSQVISPNRPTEGSHWEVSQALYTPIEQQAVLLKDSPTARAFLSYIQSNEALKIIREYGYDTE